MWFRRSETCLFPNGRSRENLAIQSCLRHTDGKLISSSLAGSEKWWGKKKNCHDILIIGHFYSSRLAVFYQGPFQTFSNSVRAVSRRTVIQFQTIGVGKTRESIECGKCVMKERNALRSGND